MRKIYEHLPGVADSETKALSTCSDSGGWLRDAIVLYLCTSAYYTKQKKYVMSVQEARLRGKWMMR